MVAPVCKELSIEVTRADKLRRPGRITDQVTEHLNSASIVVADLTGLNANVMFELGVRAGLKRPYILLARQGQQLPFDLKDFRTIFYSLDLDGAEAAKAELKEQIEAALASDDPRGGDGGKGPAASHTERDVELASESVWNYLGRLKREKGLTRVGFDGVRRWVNGTYSDELLNSVLHQFPHRFRQVRLKGNKPGIALT